MLFRSGYHAGLVSMDDAREACDLFRELDEAVSMQYPGASERVRMHEVVRGLIDALVSGLIEGTRSAAQGLAGVAAVREHPARVVCFTPLAAQAAAQLKRFLRARVYESAQLVEDRRRSVARIEALFDLLYRRPELLPTPYREE